MPGSLSLLAAGNLRIEVPAESSPAVAFAGEQLAYYLALITGRRFPLSDQPGDIRLAVAPDAHTRPGGYHLRVGTDGITIGGVDPLALLHGVYHFLEAKCGCRWLAEFEGGEIVPRNTALAVPACEERHAPVFAHRAFTNFPAIDHSTVHMVDWMCKNRFNRFMVFANMAGSFERYREVLKPHLALREMKVEMGHHSFRYWLPPGELFADHPEWYASIDGQRTPDAQLCTANPLVAATVAERINQFFGENPEIDMVGLWPNDGYGWCECAACREVEPQRPAALFPSQPARSDTYIAFVNQVAGRVAAVHPDRRLSALAYVNYVEPPTCEVAPNVAVCYAPMHRCFKHPLNAAPACSRDNARYAALFDRWRERVSDRLYLFCYLMQIDTCSLPYRITRMLGPNFQWLAAHQGDGYVMEFKPEAWGPFGVNAHLIGQLSWNPHLDVAAWLADYYRCLYGPAAAQMTECWDRLIADFIEPGPCVYHYDLTYTRRATHELLGPALEHLGRARVAAAAGERRHQAAVERAHVGIELLLRMGEYQRACAAAREGEADKRAVLVARAGELGEALLAWAAPHADGGALAYPRIERVVRAASAALAG